MTDEAVSPESEVVEEKRESKLEYISMALIRESEAALRGVDRKNEDYLQLAQSVAVNGVFEPILVREIKEGGATFYGLINGLQRYTAAKDAGLSEIPCHIMDIDESDLMEAQIITNLHRVDTKPAAYSKQLRRLISANPMLTMQDLADKLSCTVSWLNQRLSLTKLHKDIQKLVDDDELKLANAYALAKLPIDEQKEYVDRAMTDKSTEFTAVVANRVQEIKEAKKQGREPRSQEFVPIERAQTLSDLKLERKTFAQLPKVLKDSGAKTAEEGAKAALDWVLRMDAKSVEEQKAKHEQKAKERKEAQERAKAERERRAKERAAEKQQDLMAL